MPNMGIFGLQYNERLIFEKMLRMTNTCQILSVKNWNVRFGPMRWGIAITKIDELSCSSSSDHYDAGAV